MKYTYKLKPIKDFKKDPTGIDKVKKSKVEAVLDKKLTDQEWLDYKLMILKIK